MTSFPKQTLIYGTGHILVRVVTFLLLPLYTNIFSPGEYGIISLAYVFMSLGRIFYHFGFDSALMKFHVSESKENTTKSFTTIYFAQFISSLIITTCIIVFKTPLSFILFQDAFPEIISMIALILFCDTLWSLTQILLRAESRPVSFIIINLINVITTMGMNIYFIIGLKKGMMGVFYGNLTASALILFLSLFIVIPKINISDFSSRLLKKTIKFALPFLPAGLFTIIMEVSDRYLLLWLMGTEAVGIYSAGYRLGIFISLLVLSFNMGWTPYFLNLNQSKNAPRKYAQIFSIFNGIICFFMVFITLWINKIVRIKIGNVTFFGEEFWQSTEIIPVIMLGYFFSGLYVLQLPGIYATDKTRLIPLFRGIGAVSNIVLNLILIPRFGVMGAAWATAVSFGIIALTIFLFNYSQYPIPFTFQSIIIPLGYFGLACIVPGGLWNQIILTVGFIPVWYGFALRKSERELIKTKLF
ncbi:MAG: oligosaccharide flippase family protein [Candidatus Marinimicrobia bacterium]|nr:oligosaccharide flippase family protein [Candidatus Neomarinimicrobiota bacterium]